MAVTYWYVLPINPEPWTVGPAGVSKTGGKLRAYIGPDQQLKNYQNAVRTYIETAHPTRTIIDIECELRLFFWRRLDRYVTTRDRASMRHLADATNLQKALEDALQGTIVTNDRLVRRVVSEIVEQSIDAEPGIAIGISYPYKEIWKSQEPIFSGIPMGVLDDLRKVQKEFGNIDLGNIL
jgi:Holliday junction resolvase RusA-like endonuclease